MGGTTPATNGVPVKKEEVVQGERERGGLTVLFECIAVDHKDIAIVH